MRPTLLFEFNVFDPAKGPLPVRILKREVDVNPLESFSQAEVAAVAMGNEFQSAALHEFVKKKKRLWWSQLWNRIKPW